MTIRDSLKMYFIDILQKLPGPGLMLTAGIECLPNGNKPNKVFILQWQGFNSTVFSPFRFYWPELQRPIFKALFHASVISSGKLQFIKNFRRKNWRIIILSARKLRNLTVKYLFYIDMLYIDIELLIELPLILMLNDK